MLQADYLAACHLYSGQDAPQQWCIRNLQMKYLLTDKHIIIAGILLLRAMKN
jgi:hypothetical protein